MAYRSGYPHGIMRFFHRLVVRFAVPISVAMVCGVPSSAQTTLAVSGIEKGDPFEVTATATETGLEIAVVMRDGWHMYGEDVGGGEPVSVKVAKDSCVAAAGGLKIPATADGKLRGAFKLTLPLRRAKSGGGLRVTFSLMACDALMCLPPRDLSLTATKLGPAAGPLKVLVVTLDDAARSARIKAFLDGRGFACTLSKYDGLTTEVCDPYDLVVADSPNADQKTSRAAMKQRGVAMKFPRTSTPIIAVGYLGTVLLEAHEIAMACGYI